MAGLVVLAGTGGSNSSTTLFIKFSSLFSEMVVIDWSKIPFEIRIVSNGGGNISLLDTGGGFFWFFSPFVITVHDC